MKKVYLLIVSVMVIMTGCFSTPQAKKGDLNIYTVNNKDGKITAKMIEEAFKSNGFAIGVNADISDGLMKMFKDNDFKIYNNISLYDKDITLDLMKSHADAGILAPMGVVVYQSKGSDTLNIAFSSAEAQAKMIGAKVAEFKSLEDSVSEVLTTLLPSAKLSSNEESSPETRTLLTKYVLDLKGEDWEDAKDDLEENFEEKFAEAGFVMPSYFDFTEDFGENSPYDFFATYSICKIEVVRSISKVKPEAAALGPCTTMVYKKKNEDKIVMGFASVYNWISSAKVQDKISVDGLLKAQADFEAILKDVTNN